MSILKFLLAGLLFVLGLPKGNPQAVTPSNNPVTSHVLDQHTGLPVENMTVVLHRMYSSNSWTKISEKQTDENGRVSELVIAPVSTNFVANMYKLEFDTESYFKTKEEQTIFPKVEIYFEVEKENLGEHFHIPLLLNTYGYATYRGN